MIEFTSQFVETDYVSWASLAHSNASGTCEIAGWGATEHTTRMSDVLRKATLPIVPKDDCSRIYDVFDGESQICAGRPEGGIDMCLVLKLIRIVLHNKYIETLELNSRYFTFIG